MKIHALEVCSTAYDEFVARGFVGEPDYSGLRVIDTLKLTSMKMAEVVKFT